MDLSDLVTFLAVAKQGGITRASASLNTVQSNITMRIKALEDEVGVPLFERHSRGMTLTAAGSRLLPYAQKMSALASEALQAARDEGEPKGPLTLGAMETTAAVRLPPLLARFHSEYPEVELLLRTGPTAALVEAVLAGELDGAFVAGPINIIGLHATAAYEEELVLLSASRWKSLKQLRTKFLAAAPAALVFRTGCAYRQRLEQILSENGWPDSTRLEYGTLEGIIGCVAADMGVSLLPRAVVERSELRMHVTLHALEPGLGRSGTVFVRKERLHESSALLRFVDCLEGSLAVPEGE